MSLHDASNIINIIRNRFGIVIHSHQIKELNKTIIDACQKFNCSQEEYSKKLLNSPDHSPLLEHLITNITIAETYFFRDKHQMHLLQNTILPQLIKKKREQQDLSLRIWSAASASGEEIYTIGMLLDDMLPDIATWKLHLLGTDINTHLLKKALTGSYHEWSMRSISHKFKERYFHFNERQHQYILSPAIRQMVEFSYINLNDDTYPSLLNGTNAQDLILCRNVFIYLDSKCINQVMQKLCACLINGGYLLLGASDPIHIKNTALISHRESLLFSRQDTPPKLPNHPEKPSPPSDLQKRKFILPIKPRAPLSHKKAPPPKQKTPAELTAEATELANAGKLEQAVQRCRESLAIDITNKQTYFTLAMVLIELNQLTDAENALRKSLYLDHHFVIAHFQLGLLLLKNKQHQLGLKSLQNALTIATQQDPSLPVTGYQGLYYGQLADILQNEIKLHKMS